VATASLLHSLQSWSSLKNDTPNTESIEHIAYYVAHALTPCKSACGNSYWTNYEWLYSHEVEVGSAPRSFDLVGIYWQHSQDPDLEISARKPM
jgi:hypothetical protein